MKGYLKVEVNIKIIFFYNWVLMIDKVYDELINRV